jgi:hypothetical protein
MTEANDDGEAMAARERRDAAERELGTLLHLLDFVSDQLGQFEQKLRARLKSLPGVDEAITPDEHLYLVTSVASDVAQLKTTVRALWERGLDQEPDLATSATAQMAAIQSDVSYARNQFPSTPVWGRIWKTLKRAAPRLWSMICGLLKVKEWSVTGQVGIPVLGLAQAGLSVTFGR